MARSSVKGQPIPQVSVSFDKAEAARIAASTPEENILWRVVRCAGYDTDENGVQHFHHLENIACKCKLGPQGRAYWSDAFETLLGGGRGGMKTESTFGFVLKGNPSHRKCGKPWDLSYVQHPEYKVLVLRKTQTDVDEWFDRFSRIAIKAGAKATTSPMRITWPKGGYISFGHLDDRESVMKYQGKEFWRIICEEAGHFEDEGDYLKVVIGSCRTRYTSQIWPQVLLTANPGGPGHCIPHGEVLTPDGWKDIKSFQEGDSVYTVDEDGEMVETTVSQVHASHYDGDLIEYNARGFYLCATPNHSVAKVGATRYGKAGDAFSLVELQDLPGQATILRSVKWAGTPIKSFTVTQWPSRELILNQPAELTGVQYAALMGWFLSEGSVVDRDKSFAIAQEKPAGREKLAAVLDDCGFSYSMGTSQATITSPDWWAYLREFGHAHEKYIPEILKSASQPELRALFNALMDGDGTWETPGKSGYYFTVSKTLADDVCEVALKLGYLVYLYERQRDDRRYRSYAVCFKTVKSGGTELLTGNHLYNVNTKTKRKSDSARIHHSGMVYCLGIEGTHTFVVRQNGCVWISGNSWLNARFRYPHGGNTPWPQSKMYSCPYTGRTRMWILSTADDNPYQMANNAEYVRNLELLKDKDPILYRRWRLGDFDAVEGQFFERFRKEPRPGEPANARHVILEGSVKLEPWYPRAIGVDWGYKHNAAVVWGCWTPKGQLHFYRDFTINKTDPVEFGVHIARMTLPELTAMPTHQITMFLSPDAFCRENGALSEADRIAVGIRSLLGEGSAFVLAPTEEEEKLDPKAAWESVERRRRHLAANASIIIVRAQNARKPGWQLIREYLRWWKAVDAGSPFDEDLAKRILLEDGALAWLEYKKQYEQKESETLPVLQIWSNCKAFIKEIDGAQESEKDPEDIEKKDDDLLDAGRYLAVGFSRKENAIPKEILVDRKIEALGPGWENSNLSLLRRFHEARIQSDEPKAFTLPRVAGPARRRMYAN